MTVQRAFASDVKWLSLAQIFLRVKGLVIIPLMTHALGAWDYGVWTQSVAIGSLLLPFVLWGMNHGFIRHAAGQSINEQLQLLTAWILVVVGLTALISTLAYAFRSELTEFLLGTAGGSEDILYFSFGFCFSNALFQIYTSWLKTSGESKRYSLILILQSLSSLVAIVFYLVMGGDVEDLLYITLICECLFVFSCLSHVYWVNGFRSPAMGKIWEIFKYSYPLMPLTFGYLGISWGDRIILLDHMSIAEVGVYNLSHGVALMLVQTLAQPFWAYYPARFTALFEQKNMSGIQELYTASAMSFLVLIIPSILGLFVVIHDFLSLLGPVEFLAGDNALILLFVGYSVNILSGYYDQVLQVRYRQKWVTISLLACFVLNVTLNYFLIPKFGLTGAGIASVLAFVFRFMFVLFLVRRDPLFRMPANLVARVFGCAIVMGLIVDFLVESFLVGASPVVRLSVAVSVGAATFASLAIVFKVIKIETFKEIFSIPRK